MTHTDRHINRNRCNSLIVGLLLLVVWGCLSACSSGDDETINEGKLEKETTKLYIYVYTPQTASSRAYDGDVNPITRESSIYSLQIWVFTHDSHQLIGYYSPAEAPGLSGEEPYELILLTIDEDYAQVPEVSRENVDVYVLANVTATNCNLTFNETTTQAELEEALLAKTTADPFGLSSPVTTVPLNKGLPMSGVMRNQPVKGIAPVLRLDNEGEIATVQLIRMVSKLRFAFAKQTGSETLRINSIKLNSSMIPMAEYLFMATDAPYDRHTCHIKTASGYDATTPELLSMPLEDVASNDNPVYYAWGNNELMPVEYEARIETAASEGYVTQRYYYLRESDKLLQGEIKYQIGDGEEQTATFQMVDAGGFSRNHVWTVYVYMAWAQLQVVSADIAPWRPFNEEYDFYNW